MRDVAVWRMLMRASLLRATAGPRLAIEAVHAAVCARNFSDAVAGRQEPLGIVFEVPRRFQRCRLKLDLLVVHAVPIRCRFRAGKAVEKIVKAAILLNDDDDMLDFRARGDEMAGPARCRARGWQGSTGEETGPPFPLQAERKSATIAIPSRRFPNDALITSSSFAFHETSEVI